MTQEFSYLWTDIKPEIIELTGSPNQKSWIEIYRKMVELLGSKFPFDEAGVKDIAGIHCSLSKGLIAKNRNNNSYEEQSRKVAFICEEKWAKLYFDFTFNAWMIETNSSEFVENVLVILSVAL